MSNGGSMTRAMIEARLAQAERHVVEGQRHVQHQREIILYEPVLCTCAYQVAFRRRWPALLRSRPPSFDERERELHGSAVR